MPSRPVRVSPDLSRLRRLDQHVLSLTNAQRLQVAIAPAHRGDYRSPSSAPARHLRTSEAPSRVPSGRSLVSVAARSEVPLQGWPAQTSFGSDLRRETQPPPVGGLSPVLRRQRGEVGSRRNLLRCGLRDQQQGQQHNQPHRPHDTHHPVALPNRRLYAVGCLAIPGPRVAERPQNPARRRLASNITAAFERSRWRGGRCA